MMFKNKVVPQLWTVAISVLMRLTGKWCKNHFFFSHLPVQWWLL